jgi:hypothetical protein
MVVERALAKEKQREKQQGIGRPIISATVGDRRFVAVGGQVFTSTRWKTFHDFLINYLPNVFGREWLNAEMRKPEGFRHPLLINMERAANARKRLNEKSDSVSPRAATGTEAFVLDLAYNLYLLQHNAEIQATLLERLRRADQFYGAFYETTVAGILIKAGFDIEFENESDVTRKHCEFTATFRRTGRKFSVEAKPRMEGKQHLNVGSQLRSALEKQASYHRLVFIEMNIADSMIGEGADALITDIVQMLDSREDLTVHGIAVPPAYLIVTNNPYWPKPNNAVTSSKVGVNFTRQCPFRLLIARSCPGGTSHKA